MRVQVECEKRSSERSVTSGQRRNRRRIAAGRFSPGRTLGEKTPGELRAGGRACSERAEVAEKIDAFELYSKNAFCLGGGQQKNHRLRSLNPLSNAVRSDSTRNRRFSSYSENMRTEDVLSTTLRFRRSDYFF